MQAGDCKLEDSKCTPTYNKPCPLGKTWGLVGSRHLRKPLLSHYHHYLTEQRLQRTFILQNLAR
jgi:hypothetical protein